MGQIPKIIHYCWFGNNEKPSLVKQCIQSWKHYCPDYEIIEWNETNYNVGESDFIKEAYEAKQWAFVSDYVRAYVLSEYGGIYLDTDLELLQPMDGFLTDNSFLGFEVNDLLATGVIVCAKNNSIIRAMFEYYQNKHFEENGKRVIPPSPMIITQIMKENGLKPNGRKQTMPHGWWPRE